MFKILLLRSLHDILISGRFLTILTTMLLYSSIVTFVQTEAFQAQMVDYNLVKSNLQEDKLMFKPSAMSVFILGSSKSNAGPVGVDFRKEMIYEPPKDIIEEAAYFDDLDLHWGNSNLLTLCALLLAANVIIREKERKRLSLLFSYDLKRSNYLAATIASYSLASSLVVLVVQLVSLFIVNLQGISFSAEEFLMVGIYTLLTMLLSHCYIAFGVAISSFAKNSSYAAFAALSLWLFLNMIFPSWLGPISDADELSRSASEFKTELALEFNRVEKEAHKQIASLNRSGKSIKPDGLEAYQIIMDARSRAALNIYSSYAAQESSRAENLLQNAYLLPSTSFFYIGMELANVGVTDFVNKKYFATRFYSKVQSRLQGFRIGEPVIMQHYSEIHILSKVADMLNALFVFLIWGGLSLLISVVRFNSYDLR